MPARKVSLPVGEEGKGLVFVPVVALAGDALLDVVRLLWFLEARDKFESLLLLLVWSKIRADLRGK